MGERRLPAAVLGIASLCLLGSLFLHWWQSEGEFLVLFGALDRQPALQNGWQALAGVDLVLAGAAAAGLFGAVLLVRGRAERRTLAALALVTVVALAAVAVRVSAPPDPTLEAGPGAYVAFGALLVMLAASVVSALRPAVAA